MPLQDRFDDPRRGTIERRSEEMKLTVKRQRSGITIRVEIGDVILTIELPK
jgi:hypothetical protein